MEDNRLQVAGIARSEVAPDRVEWQLIVHEAGPDARDAFARCSARLRAIEGGADELRGPTLHTSGIEEARDALYAEAVHAARRRAQAMADAAGRTLGRVLSVGDHDDFDMLVAEGHSGAMSLSSGGMPSPPVVPRPTPISAAVQVVFELTGS
jgi:uncharacterized protein YggE